MLLVATLAAVLALAAASSPCDTHTFRTVTTNNGLVLGHSAGCVLQYLGIPYAEPPVGAGRFAEARKLTASKLVNASQFGDDCPQLASPPLDYPDLEPHAQRVVSYFTASAGTSQSEDCLTLNIWARTTAASHSRTKPVLVFFHGGRFAIGNTNSPFYHGRSLASAQDIIIVTVNYRLNVFGFPGIPGQTQNLGLRDLRTAVEWIRDNIRAFGGDPSRITISGQSSGGVAVDYWTYAYTHDPIVSGVIAMSGNAFSFPVHGPGVAERNWNLIVQAVGCAEAADSLACMRQAEWKKLRDATGSVPATGGSSVLRSTPPFYPSPDCDVVFPDYPSRARAGNFARVPALIGNTDDEDGYYRLAAYRNGIIPTHEQRETFVLESFTCPVSFFAQTRRAAIVPTYIYRYMPDWPNLRLYNDSGAYHGVDGPLIFGTSEEVSGIEPSGAQVGLSELMQSLWYLFSKDPRDGLGAFGWPAFNPDSETLALQGRNNRPILELVEPSEYDWPCGDIVMGGETQH